MADVGRERPRAECALPGRVEEIVDAVEDGITIVDESCRITYANGAAARVFGVSREQLVGKFCDDRAFKLSKDGPATPEERRACCSPLETGEALHSAERTIRRPDGSSAVVLASAAPWRDVSGRLVGVINSYTDITERKAAEDALRKSEERFRRFVETAQEGIWAQGADYRTTFVNDELARMLGYRRDELIGRPAIDFVYREDRRAFREQMRGRREGQASRYELRLARSDGSLIWTRISATAVLDDSGAFRGAFAMITDITESKEADRALREGEERYRSLVDASPDAIVVYQRGMVIFANPAAVRVFGGPGRTSADLIGRPVIEFVHPDSREIVGKRMMRMQQERMPLPPIEEKYVRLDGHEMIVELAAIPFSWQGEPAVQAVARDVTDRKRAEEDLRNARGQLERSLMFNEALLTAVPTPAFYKDRQGRYLGCNSAFSEFTGVTPQQMAGKTVMEIWPGENAAVYHEKDLELMRHPAMQVYEFKVRDRDGVDRPVIFAKNVFRDENKQVAGIVGVFTDITDRKHAEEALRESEERYRRIVDTSTEGIWVLGPDNTTTLVNARMAGMLGRSVKEMTGRPVTDFMFDEDKPDHLRKMENRRRGISEHYERRFLSKDGQTLWTLASATPIFDDKHRFMGSFAMFTDITQMKAAEEELRTKDLAIRRAYVDVIAAVTGNRLILMTPDEIDAALGEPVGRSHRITSYRTLSKARAQIRNVIATRMPDGRDTDEFIVGVGEALTNVVKHARGGRYGVRRRNGIAQVVIADRGPGVDFTTVPRATLEMGFSTKGTLGVGFTIMLETSDRVLLSTQKGKTVLVLELSG